MNSVEALNLALGLVRKEQRRLTRRPIPNAEAREALIAALTPLGEAETTLEALRELIADNERRVETRD